MQNYIQMAQMSPVFNAYTASQSCTWTWGPAVCLANVLVLMRSLIWGTLQCRYRCEVQYNHNWKHLWSSKIKSIMQLVPARISVSGPVYNPLYKPGDRIHGQIHSDIAPLGTDLKKGSKPFSCSEPWMGFKCPLCQFYLW